MSPAGDGCDVRPVLAMGEGLDELQADGSVVVSRELVTYPCPLTLEQKHQLARSGGPVPTFQFVVERVRPGPPFQRGFVRLGDASDVAVIAVSILALMLLLVGLI